MQMEEFERILVDHEDRLKILEKTETDNRVTQALMQQDLKTISDTVVEIKADVKSLGDNRLHDHYIEPVNQWRKIKWSLIALVATSIVTMLITIIVNSGKH